MLAKWWIAAAAALAATAAGAQDVSLLAGRTKAEGIARPTFGFDFSYTHDISPNLAAGFSYVNEGHVTGHHRDGVAAQLWLQGETAPGVKLGLAAGPYQYFDTTLAETADGFHDAHGTPNSTQLLVGVGYRLDQDGSSVDNSTGKAWQRGNNDEVVLYAGQTVVNSFESESNAAYAVEYRRAFGPVLRGSLAWLKEGDARLIRRDGVLAQGWLEPSFRNDRWTMGLGYGAYFAVDDYRSTPRHVSPVIATTLSYNVAGRWTARLNWYRVISNYDRDSDVFLLGAGYRF